MLNIIEERLAESHQAVRNAVQEQSNRVASELNANVDMTNGHMARFSTSMTTAKQLRQKADELEAAAVRDRQKADEIEAAAIRDLDTALTNAQGVQLSIVQQIADGQMVTGSDTPAIPPRKPHLRVATGAEAVAP